jgi:formamidopyrimidine-DNA glycosylase
MGLSGGWCYLKNDSTKYEFSKNMEDYAKFMPSDKIKLYIKHSIDHLNVEFVTTRGSLYFFDMLSFGSLKVVKGEMILQQKLNKIGPDIMEPTTDFTLFKNKIKNAKNLNKSIGIVLMDQTVISGIGNYLRSDILYISKINPFRKVKKMNNIEIKKIYKNSKILTWYDYDYKKAHKMGILNDKTKLPSHNNRLFYVYNQTEDIYGNKVIKKELYEGSQKRFIYYVPVIQK